MNSFKHRVVSLSGILVLIANLLTAYTPLANARTISPVPAADVHQPPLPNIALGHGPFTPLAASGGSVLPGWFKPPVASSSSFTFAPDLTYIRPATSDTAPERSIPIVKPAAPVDIAVLPSRFEGDEVSSYQMVVRAVSSPGPKPAKAADVLAAPDNTILAEPVPVLPPWFAAEPPAAKSQVAPAPSALPDWFSPRGQPNPDLPVVGAKALPGWFADPSASPPPGPMPRDIPLSLLSVDITGPNVASVGSPPGFGEVYTAVIRNNSSDTAYGLYLTATHPSFFIHDGGDQLISSTGAISVNVVAGTSAITWTPVSAFNLVPGEAITLNFKLRATCGAQSGQRLEVGVRYNADPPPESPIELNTGGLNITTGRGNLVIRKEPALQNLGTPDFGQPITWIVTVQNTGLGKLYNAVITDTGGINLSQPTGDLTPSVTIPVLDVNEVQTYTVVGTVEACNFTNVAQGSWPCGNLVGDATVTNPLSSTASVLFTPQAPNINVQVSTPITFPYCGPITRTVTITIDNTGGPAADFRLDSTFESDGFLEVVTSSVSSGWGYTSATGLFSYTGGSPTGTIPGAGGGLPVTLTFQVRPQSASVCAAGSGDIAFTPLYNDICSGSPFTANPVSLAYQYAQDEAPTLSISKSGPPIVASGDVFTYQITVTGTNPVNINGAVNATDVLPSQFSLLGPITPSTGVATTTGQTVTWSFDPPDAPATFTETLTYLVQAVVTDTLCGAGLIVNNDAQALAVPSCPGCPSLNATAGVRTAIENNEGIFPGNSASGSFEVCGSGFTVVNSYLITGSTTVTWNGAVFTEALGTAIDDGALPGPTFLMYQSGSLSVTVNGVDYTSVLTPVTTTGQLVVDLSPLETALPPVPTQNLTLLITYTIEISEDSLNGAVKRQFYDWSQLFLPDLSGVDGCAANNSFNQVLILTIGRGDLTIDLAPQILDKCSANPVIITVNDNAPGRLTDNIVITFTSSTAEILSARNFTYTGSLASIGAPTVISDADTGGGLGVITFTFPSAADIDGDGEIRFEVDVNCTDESPWNAGITFQSRCGLPHGDTATRDHVYRAPNLLLFATPLQYTAREKEVIWKFFLTNNGNLTATNVLVTNTIQGLSVFTYTSDGPGVSISGALPITDPNPVVFTIDEIAPNEQRAITVTANVIACDPLHVTINAELACFGTTCSQPQAEVSFDTPDPYLLTNNGETADLPMCDLGEVIFTTKNASADVTLYQLNITETLIGLAPAPGEPITVTIVDADSNVIASTTAFTPEVTSTSTQTLLIWKAVSATTEVVTWFNALPPLYVVRIFVPVRTSCVPPNVPQSFAAADALGPCGKKLGYIEDAVTLQTLSPDMAVIKDGMVAGGSFGDTIYVTPGQTVTWRIRVYNYPSSRSYVAQNVVLSDTWPANFDFITATLSYTPTVITPQRTITWDIGDMAPQVDPLEFFITGTVAVTDDACAAATINTTRLTFGCDDDGCTSDIAPIDTAQLGTEPSLQVAVIPGPLQTCQGDIPIRIRNYGAAAYSNTLTVTLPSGYAYSQTISSGLTPTQIITDSTTPQFKWDMIPGRTGSSPYQFTLVLRVRNSGASGVCPVSGGQPVTATLEYDNHAACTLTGPFFDTDTTNLNVRSPSFNVQKSPGIQPIDVGQRITWTLTVANTGDGTAENVVVTDAVGSNYNPATIIASNGSDGSGPTILGNVITWTPSNISAGGSWTATVSAVLLSSGDNRNVVTAAAGCATGCETAFGSDTAYATLLQSFEKNPPIQTGTISSLVVFTFAASLSDMDAVYENLTLIDTLPAGLGYVSSVLTATYDIDGNQGGPDSVISTTPTITPGGLASGDVVWALGDTPGTVKIGGLITAVIQDISASQDGVRLTNVLTMTYTEDGQSYVHTDTADVDIEVPALVVDKVVDPARAAPGAIVTWTLNVRNVGSGTAYGVDIADTLPSIYFTYDPNSSFLNGAGPIADPTIAGLDLFWDLNQTLPGSGAFTLTFRTVVSDAAPQGVYTNVARAVNGADELGNPIPPDNTDHVPGDTDLDDTDDAVLRVTLMTVSKNVEDSTLAPNQVTTYTIRLDNPGGNSITVTVTDTLPAAFSYADSATPREPDDDAPPILVWNDLGPIAAGGSLTITFRITAATQVSGVYTNTVDATGEDEVGNVVTETDDVTVTLETHPGIVVTKTRMTSSPVLQDDQVVYSLTVHNIGDTTLFTVPLVDTYNANHLRFDAASVAPNATTPAGTLTWNDLTVNFGDFTSGMSGTVVVTCTALYAPGGVTTTNSVSVTGVDTNTTAVTDTDTATVSILAPRLELDKQVTPTGPISPGDVLSYTICYSNTGSYTATGVVLTDFIPTNLTYLTGTATSSPTLPISYYVGSGWQTAEPVSGTLGLRWTIGTLPPGGSGCAGFSGRVNMTVLISGLSLFYTPQGWLLGGPPGPTLELTPVVTPTLTPTPTPVVTPTITPSPSAPEGPAGTATMELTPTLTPTSLPIPTPAPTPPVTPTITPTVTPSPGAPEGPGGTATPWPTPTATLGLTPTAAPIPPPTLTPTTAPTGVPTVPVEITSTAASPTPVITITPTADITSPVSQRPPGWALPAWWQATVTPTLTPTGTPEPTATPTTVPTTETPSPTVTPTAVSATETPTSAVTPTDVPAAEIPTPTAPEGPSETSTPTAAPVTEAPTLTATPTETPTPTAAVPATETPMPTTETPAVTPTPVITMTPTATVTATPVVTVTPTATVTPTPAVVITATPTPDTGEVGLIVPFEEYQLTIVNTATIGSDQTPTETDAVDVPLVTVVDPRLTKQIYPTQAQIGDEVTIVLIARNHGNANATNVVVRDQLPLELDLLSVSASRGVTDAIYGAAGVFTVTIGVLGPGEDSIITARARVNNNADPPATIVNVATVDFTEGTSRSSNPTTVDVPREDEDDDQAPTPTATPTPVLTVTVTLPVSYLPETGVGRPPVGVGLPGLALLLVVLALVIAGRRG